MFSPASSSPGSQPDFEHMNAIHMALPEGDHPVELLSKPRDPEVYRLLADAALSTAVEVGQARIETAQAQTAAHEMEKRVMTDTLTGARTREAFNSDLEALHAQADREGSRIGILFVDLDGFKDVNDTLGHDIGDEALKHFFAAAKSVVRKGDLVYRLGGDEFVIPVKMSKTQNVLVPNDKNGDSLTDEDAIKTLSRLGAEIDVTYKQEIAKDPRTASAKKLGASVGVSLMNEGETPAEALKRADSLMYEVKKARKQKQSDEAATA